MTVIITRNHVNAAILFVICAIAAGAITTVDWNTQVRNKPSIPPGNPPFNTIASGSNTTATMTVGTGASLAPTGSGTISANQANGGAFPTSATVLATNGSAQPIAASVQGNGSKAQLATGSTTLNDIIIYDTNGNAIDSSTLIGNVVTAGSAAGAANQICVSGGATKTCSYISLPETHIYQMAACNNNVSGPGVNIPTSNAPAIACRTGSNVQAGVIEFTAANQNVQLQSEIPLDWDTSQNPFASLLLTQGNGNGSQTITMQIAGACGATDDAAFQTAQNFPNITTNTTANTQYKTTIQLNNTTMTSCTAGSLINLKITASAIGTNQAWAQYLVLTWPRKIVVQAN